MDWILYDNGLRHERVKETQTFHRNLGNWITQYSYSTDYSSQTQSFEKFEENNQNMLLRLYYMCIYVNWKNY